LDNNSLNVEKALDKGLSADAIKTMTQLEMAYPGPFCQTAEDHAYLAHINTPNVARDMDLIRNLTGYQTLDYWGSSYGTLLGTMYAALFPDRVGKIVLDGICNQIGS
jgi:pimeloyl-ACP methyl ester carboxylesterase